MTQSQGSRSGRRPTKAAASKSAASNVEPDDAARDAASAPDSAPQDAPADAATDQPDVPQDADQDAGDDAPQSDAQGADQDGEQTESVDDAPGVPKPQPTPRPTPDAQPSLNGAPDAPQDAPAPTSAPKPGGRADDALNAPKPVGGADDALGSSRAEQFAASPVQEPTDGMARPTAAGLVTQTSTAAPLEPPGDTEWPRDGHVQTSPVEGIGHASTNPVADAMGQSNLAGEDHVAIVDDDGREVDLDEAFIDGGPHQTFLTAKRRLWELFQYPGTTTPTRRLYVGTPGATKPRADIARLKAARPKARAQRDQRDA